MKKQKIYYKAIHLDRTSAIIWNPLVAIKYPVKEWAYPKITNSKLMVFEYKHDALGIISGTAAERVVVPCYVKNPVNAGEYNMKTRYPIIDASTINLGNFVDNLADFWKEISIRAKRTKLVDDIYSGADMGKWTNFLFDFPPDGTILCDAVYCLE